MPNTSLLFLLIFAICVVGSFVNPLWGMVGYLLEYYQRPSLHWWGRFLPDLRWNFTIALVFALSFFVKRNSLPPVRDVRNVGGVMLILLGINMLLVQVWAVAPEMSWHWTERYWKTIFVYFLIVGVVRTRWAFDLFLLLNMVGAAWWGFDALDQRRVSSRMEGVGSSDTLNSNLLAAHLLTILPAMVLFVLAERDKRLRVAALACLPLVLNLFILANSRGATVGLVAAALCALLLVRGSQRPKAVVGVAAAALTVYLLADPQFIERQRSTADAGDGSAQTRVTLWNGALEMIGDYPFGLGGRGFHIMSPRYAPGTASEDADMGRSAHNTYLQMTAEWGVQGFVLWMAFLGFTGYCLHRARKESADPDWFYYRSLAVELGLIGTLVAGIFSVRFYGESIYWLGALGFALLRIPREAPVADATSESADPDRGADGPQPGDDTDAPRPPADVGEEPP